MVVKGNNLNEKKYDYKNFFNYLKVVPWGFTNTLKWIKDRYGDVPIIVTENGFPDEGEEDDQDRISYHKVSELRLRS